MYTLSAQLVFYIPHSTSLKDKRRIRKSLVDKTRHKFNVSIAEVGTLDMYQTLTIGIAIVSGEYSHGDKVLHEIIRFVENTVDGELVSVEKE